MKKKQYFVDGDWLYADDFSCSSCGNTIEDNGGYMALIHGDWVCATDENNAQCWWEVIVNYADEIIDMHQKDINNEVREAKDEQ